MGLKEAVAISVRSAPGIERRYWRAGINRALRRPVRERSTAKAAMIPLTLVAA